MAYDMVPASELYDVHLTHERERSKLELRIGTLEDELKRRKTLAAGEFAKRKDFEAHLDAFDELVAICKKQQRMIEFLFFANDLDPNGEDFDE